MLPGVDFTEMLLVAVIAVVVFGPRDLPLMMRKVGRFTGKMRAMAFEFKQGIDELGRQAELEELRKEVADLKKHTGLEELRDEFAADKRALEEDVRAVMSDPKIEASAAEPATSETSPNVTPALDAPDAPPVMRGPPAFPKPPKRTEPAPYAGLSADHPGYDEGSDPAPAEPAAAEASDEAKQAGDVQAGDVQADDVRTDNVHVVPDNEVRLAHPAAPTHPAAKVAGAKQGSPV